VLLFFVALIALVVVIAIAVAWWLIFMAQSTDLPSEEDVDERLDQ
jgi:cytoskeletal protein RodZ